MRRRLVSINLPDNPSLYFIPGTRIGGIGVSNIAGLGPDSETPSFFDYKSFQIYENLTFATGRHTMKAGMSWTRWFNDQDAAFQFGGSYAFTSLEDFIRGTPNTFEGTVPGSTTARRWRQNLFGMFVQDDFAVSNRLTLNMGVRYEFITEPKEAEDRVAHMVTVLDPGADGRLPALQQPVAQERRPAPRLCVGCVR